MREDKGSPNFEKEIKGGNFNLFNDIPYLMTYHWKVILTRKVMKLRKGFYDIAGQNGGLSKFTSCRTLKSCHFRTELTYTSVFLPFQITYHSKRAYDQTFSDPTLEEASNYVA